jgi:hypothetical protein
MKHYPPARLGDIAEANYRRHITMRAGRLGIREADLTAWVEWHNLITDIAKEVAS